MPFEKELAPLEMIEQPARRRDHHVGAAIELAVLVVIGHAADEQRHGQLVALAEDLEMLGHLGRELARRLEDQGSRHARPCASALEPRQHGQHEGRGLAGPGLRDAEHVATGDRVRDGLILDWGRGFEARRGDGGQNFRAQAKM